MSDTDRFSSLFIGMGLAIDLIAEKESTSPAGFNSLFIGMGLAI